MLKNYKTVKKMEKMKKIFFFKKNTYLFPMIEQFFGFKYYFFLIYYFFKISVLINKN